MGAVAFCDEQIGYVGSDKSCTAGDEYVHVLLSELGMPH
jgi:hypothetical protein